MDIQTFFQGLDALYAQGDPQKAEPYLTAGLEMAEAEEDLSAAVSILNELGGFYRVHARFREGKRVFVKAMHYIRRLGLENTQGHATTLLNYATTLTAAGEIPLAASEFSRAAAIFEAAPGGQYKVAALHNNISSLYLRQKEYAQALEQSKIALDTIRLLPDCWDEEGVTHTIRAQTYTRMEEPEQAEAELLQAQQCFEKASGASPVHLATLYSAWGDAWFFRKNFTTSRENYEKALPLAKLGTGQHSQAVSGILHNLIRCCLAMDDRTGADAYRAQLTPDAAAQEEMQ